MKGHHEEDPQDLGNEIVSFQNYIKSFTTFTIGVTNKFWKINFDEVCKGAGIAFISPYVNNHYFSFCIEFDVRVFTLIQLCQIFKLKDRQAQQYTSTQRFSSRKP